VAKQSFPKDFLWGAATSGHQVDGGSVDQWSEWELAHASELARTAKLRLDYVPNWDDIKARAKNPDNYVSGPGADHIRHYAKDLDLLKKLQMDSFRFSIEWARLEPEQGTWNDAAIRHYHTYIKAMKRRGIEPVPTLWHWTVPAWFAALGGFEKKQNLQHFERFVAKVAEEFGNDFRYVVTLNEPKSYVLNGYMTGEWPPQKSSKALAYKVYKNLAQAHNRAYDILKKEHPTLQAGIAAGPLDNNRPKRPGKLADALGLKWKNYSESWWFVNRINKRQDFVGVNYYHTNYCQGLKAKVENPDVPQNDLGWHMEPDGLYPVLMEAWRRYGKPIIITENGLADEDDRWRRWWLEQTMIAMRRAMADGVQLSGYFHWSLLDNFEWSYGWWPKFGLVEVDRLHAMKRTPRESAKWLAAYLIKLRGSRIDVAQKPNDASAAKPKQPPKAAANTRAQQPRAKSDAPAPQRKPPAKRPRTIQ
jgi:beta-glucosidase